MNEEQITYVLKQLQSGTDESVIRQNLTTSGYQEDVIDQLLQAAKQRHSSNTDTPPHPGTPPSDTNQTNSDESNKKMYGILGYVLPFLFFLPLVNEGSKNDPFVRYHANQQLNLLITGVVIFTILPMFITPISYMAMGFSFVSLIFTVAQIAMLVLMVMGIINVTNGQMKPLPVIGGFSLLK